MAYTTPEELRQRLAPDGSEAATSGTAASLDDGDLERHITDADQEVDARLSSRFQTPFEDPPKLVVTISQDIAAYLATLTYRRNVPLAADDPVRLRYARAQALLAAAAKGELDLVEAEGAIAGASEAHVENLYDGDLFTLEDFSLGAVGKPPWVG